MLVAVGDADQRDLDAVKRKVVADWLGVPAGEMPAVEAGYKLVTRGDEQSSEVNIEESGSYMVIFAEIPSSFGGYRPYLVEGPAKFYGRVCRDSEDCDTAIFRELSSFLSLDEDVGSGSRNVAPWTVLNVFLPDGLSLRIEVVAYYTSRSEVPTSTPTPSPVPTATPTITPTPVGGTLVLVAVGDSGQRTVDAVKRGLWRKPWV